MGRYSGNTCRLSVMLSLTFTFFLVEIIFGYITNSMALIADSFHMLSDVVALIIAFFCMKISRKRSSSKNTFGWVRAEVLGALINAVFLIALCFSIFIEALKRLIEPEPIHEPEKILIVGVMGLIVNVIGIFMFHGHASVHGHSHARPVPLNMPVNGDVLAENSRANGRLAGERSVMISGEGGDGKPVDDDDDDRDEDEAVMEQVSNTVVSEAHNISFFNTAGSGSQKASKRHSTEETAIDGHENKKASPAATQMNMHGVFLHILGDAFGSIIVIVNAVICWQVENESLQKYLDPSLSLVMAIIIFSTTLPLFKESAFILLQTVPTHIDVENIKRKLLKSIDGVLAVHEFHVWRLAGNKIIATAHIRCRNLDEYMKIAENVKQLFHDEGIHSTTIQPEFDEVTAPHVDLCVLNCPKKSVCAPSMCCSGTVATTAEETGNLEKGIVPSGSAGKISVGKDQSPRSYDDTAPNAPSVPDQSFTQPSTSSNSSDEGHFKGVPPILYYNKGYNLLGGEKTS